MIPKKILEKHPSLMDISKEDLETMREGQKNLIITDEKHRKISKRYFKKFYPDVYYWGLHRATFHYTSERDIEGKIYYFKNDFLFS